MTGSPVTLDDKLRTRLAEIRAAAGVPHAQISMEVLYFLPKDFLDKYAELFYKAVKSDGGESNRNTAQQNNAEVGKATGPGAKTTGKRYKKTFVVLDDAALDFKTRMDKRLRSMARDIDLMLAGEWSETSKQVRCKSCMTFMQNRWRWCPLCGHQVED